MVRHAERADSAFALFKGLPWTRSEDSQRWPLDPPLSDAGEVGALEAAEVLHDHAKNRCDAGIDVVVTSPYLRCVQTAAVICAKLGSDTRLMIDASMGEIFGPDIFGDHEPTGHRRPLQFLLDECKLRGVDSAFPKLFGAEPSWPENSLDGRHRFSESFLKYQERSCYGCRSFIIVTHGDCVAAATALFPFPARVRGVEPGGMLLASRRAKKSSELWLSSVTSRSKWQNSSNNKTMSCEDVGCHTDVHSQPLCPAATKNPMGGWSVDSHLIHFEESRTRGTKQVLKTMARLTASSNRSSGRVQALLDSFSCKHHAEADEVHDYKMFKSKLRSRSITGRNFVLALTSMFTSRQEDAEAQEETQDDAQECLGQEAASCSNGSQDCLSEDSTRTGSKDTSDRTWTASTAASSQPPLPEDEPEIIRMHSAYPTPMLRTTTDPSPLPIHMSLSSSLWQRRTSL